MIGEADLSQELPVSLVLWHQATRRERFIFLFLKNFISNCAPHKPNCNQHKTF